MNGSTPLLRYSTILADPPWQFKRGFNGFGKRRPLPYDSMTFEQIAALPLPLLLEREGYLFMWTTNAHLPLALMLIERWGFSYRQTLTWDKGIGSGGLGGMFATTSEFVVISQNIRPGTNAHGSRTNHLRHPESVLRFPRQPRHSQKPEAFQDVVESVAPGPYLELFARRPRLGWDAWGNEVESDIRIEDFIGQTSEAVDMGHALLLDCTCAGPLSNVTVDGNGGHSPSCPLNPRNLPHNLTHCAGCDLPFDAPMLDEGCDPYGEYVCEGCFV